MSALSHIPYDIIIFGIVSVLLAYRLRGVLGRRMGSEPMVAVSPAAAVAPVVPPSSKPETDEPAASFDVPAPGTRVGDILVEIAKADPGFSATQFLRGAETSFRAIVTAFAMGDRDKLAHALTPAACKDFVAAIDAREAEEQVQQTEIVAVNSLAIQDAVLTTLADGQREGTIDVLIVSRQISLLHDRDAQPLVGTESVTEFSDLWRFERIFGAPVSGASWRLASVRAA
ncbi:Tim44/TimA family putative adaptor protein [Brytella acorum]|uniref:Tim44/TimA family putative adaptor protein n=1 Tax=Brytella acorum TaxID=2959299 RepID=A0AA35UIW4_9PROT|nr:Tim44/TimA family putative adaptor protein [Brytella acorum]MDF3624308.1 Tim44/TimA family putative adaptor protein [Brytella acorum]CAI9121118.1 Tim44/TimA family putative adaptor protein [Brytella acorum]